MTLALDILIYETYDHLRYSRSLPYEDYKAKVKLEKKSKKKTISSKRKAPTILDKFHAAKKARFMFGKSHYDRPVLSTRSKNVLMAHH